MQFQSNQQQQNGYQYNYPTYISQPQQNPQQQSSNYNYPPLPEQQQLQSGPQINQYQGGGNMLLGGYVQEQQPGSPFGLPKQQVMKLPRTADGVRFPVEIECQYCRKNTKTRIEYKSGQQVCCCSCILLFTFPICIFVPCCIDDYKDVYHYCTQCGHQVGFTRKKCCD